MNELDAAYPLTEGQRAAYARDGYVRLPHVLSRATIDQYAPAIVGTVARLNANPPPLDERSTYGKAFLQTFNLWRRDPTVKQLVFSRRLAAIAAQLLGVPAVRLYHDQALDKEPGGGHTPWHADQFYWPLDNDRSITLWLPLQPIDLAMGPLGFAPGSQALHLGRDLEISDDSEATIGATLKEHGYSDEISPYGFGDASFHSGWVFHHAGTNQTDRPRRAMTVIYIDAATRLREPKTPQERFDAETWCPGVRPGETINSSMNPILYESDVSSAQLSAGQPRSA